MEIKRSPVSSSNCGKGLHNPNPMFGTLVFLIGCSRAVTPAQQVRKRISVFNVNGFILTCKSFRKALYQKNLASLQSGIAAFEKKDINGWAATVADSAKWNSPMYGASQGKKEDWKSSLSSYMADWNGLKLENANFLPGIDSTTQEPDGSVRYYGVWTGVHKSGVKTSLKFYATYDFNKDGKIIFGDEYFDLGGLMN